MENPFVIEWTNYSNFSRLNLERLQSLALNIPFLEEPEGGFPI